MNFVIELPLSEIGQSYGRLRLVSPRADNAMLTSIRRYGQITPVVVGRPDGKRYELVDGFKRLRALTRLGQSNLKAQVLDVCVRALKASMLQLNRSVGPLCAFEESLVVHSLHREEGLTQVDISVLLGRNKSWVSRRIGLIERLDEEVLKHIELGLIGAGIGRQLIRLPRGNQGQVLRSILTHRLTYRETEKLVSELLARPRFEHESILRAPCELMPGPNLPSTARQSLSHLARNLTEQLGVLEPLCLCLIQRCDTTGLEFLAIRERESLNKKATRISGLLHDLLGLLERLPP